MDVTAGYSAPANSNTRQGTDGYVIASTSTHQASDPDYQTLPNPDTSTSTLVGNPTNPNPNYAGGEGYGSRAGAARTDSTAGNIGGTGLINLSNMLDGEGVPAGRQAMKSGVELGAGYAGLEKLSVDDFNARVNPTDAGLLDNHTVDPGR